VVNKRVNGVAALPGRNSPKGRIEMQGGTRGAIVEQLS
jgi:hypothetical protein